MSAEFDKIRRGIAARRAGDRELARETFNEILESNPDQTWARVELAREWADAGDIDRALALVEAGAMLPSADVHVCVAIATLHERNGNDQAAVDSFTAATMRFPNKALPIRKLAEYLAKKGEQERAARILQDGFVDVGSTGDKDSIAESYLALMSRARLHKLITVDGPPPEGRAIMNSCVVSLVKDEGDIIYQQLSHSYRVGFRYFVLANNNSTDDTVEEIRRFGATCSDAIVVVVDDPVVQYFQNYKTTALAKFAHEYFSALGTTIEWIFAFDADEFLSVPPGVDDLKSILDDRCLSKHILAMTLHNCSSDYPLPEYSSSSPHYLAFPWCEMNPESIVHKCAYRFANKARFTMGNHYISGLLESWDDIAFAADYGAFIKHYPYRSVAHLRKKVVNAGKALSDPRIVGGGHWRDQLALYQKHGEDWLQNYLNNYIAKISAR